LQFLGRNHTVQSTISTILALQSVGMDTIGLDLIYGLPQSTTDTVSKSLDKMLSYSPQHISTYGLSIEPNTPFKRQQQPVASSDASFHQYQLIRRFLSKKGYDHYEVSNFGKPGHYSRHNLSYWQFEDYIGLGPGAHSFFNQYRYHHARDLDAYCHSPIPRIYRQQSMPKINHDVLMMDFILFCLRKLNGFSVRHFNTYFQDDFNQRYSGVLSQLRALKLLRQSQNRIQLTMKGLLVLDSVAEAFIGASR